MEDYYFIFNKIIGCLHLELMETLIHLLDFQFKLNIKETVFKVKIVFKFIKETSIQNLEYTELKDIKLF